MKNSLTSFFNEHNLDHDFLRQLRPVSRWWNRWRVDNAHYLVCPHRIYRLRDDIDQEILYDRKFIPIGHCPNGDFIIVPVSNEWHGLTAGRVYFLAMELASVEDDEVASVTREVADSVQEFIEESSKGNLPLDYWEDNDNAYRRPRRKLGSNELE